LADWGCRDTFWVRSGDLAPLVASTVAALVGLPLATLLVIRLKGRKQDIPAKLVEAKLAEPAFATQLRLLAFGPQGTAPQRLQHHLEITAAAYRAYDNPSGIGLRPRQWRADPMQPLIQGGLFHRSDVLNAAEVAALWHPLAEVLRGERMGARHVLPSSPEVRRGCPVGVSAHQGTVIPVHMPHALLFRNQLVVAKTRRGKSTLLLHLATYFMERMATRRSGCPSSLSIRTRTWQRQCSVLSRMA
jgi:hypothetical protein